MLFPHLVLGTAQHGLPYGIVNYLARFFILSIPGPDLVCKNQWISMAVPNGCISIREILRRALRGIGSPSRRPGRACLSCLPSGMFTLLNFIDNYSEKNAYRIFIRGEAYSTGVKKNRIKNGRWRKI